MNYPEMNLVTAFANKEFCFEDYCRGIENLYYPKDKIHYLAYNNSNSDSFREKIVNFATKNFANSKIIDDDTPHFTIDNSEDYSKIDPKIREIYNNISKEVDSDQKYTLIIEDDNEVSANVAVDLLKIFDIDSKIKEAGGVQRSRRLKDRKTSGNKPLVWNWKKGKAHIDNTSLVQEKPFGIESVGAISNGCTMIDTEEFKKMDIEKPVDGLQGVDLIIGRILTKKGFYVAINWSVISKHYYLKDGKKGYY